MVKYLGPPIPGDPPDMTLEEALATLRQVLENLERQIGPGGIPKPDPDEGEGRPKISPGDPPLPGNIQPIDGDLFPPEE